MTSPTPAAAPLISADDQEFLADRMAEWLMWMQLPQHQRHEERLKIPAEKAARLWLIRSRLESAIPGLFNLNVLLKHMHGHNCGVCGEPDRPECAQEC